MEPKSPKLGGPPTQVSRQNKRPSRVAPTRLLEQSHFFASVEIYFASKGQGQRRGPRGLNPCLKKSLPLRIAFRLPGFLAALPVSWESPRHCWRRGVRWREEFFRSLRIAVIRRLKTRLETT